jgi:serine O-acetyltransferase
MIKSKQDYLEYLNTDMIVNHVEKFSTRITSYRWKYIKSMRKVEYLTNCKSNNIVGKIRLKIARYFLKRISVLTGISIPPNTFGKGLFIPHYGSIVVNGSARFGDYCIIQNGVNVSEGVIGGDYLFLGAGCKILIGVNIPNYCIVGANAVVTKSVEEENVVLGGIPAKIISRKGTKNRDRI